MNLLKQHLPWVLTMLVAIATSYSNLRVFQTKVEFEQADMKARLAETAQRVATIEAENKQTGQSISELKSDLRVVVEWVKDQKRREK